jgi:hypothetical protein
LPTIWFVFSFLLPYVDYIDIDMDICLVLTQWEKGYDGAGDSVDYSVFKPFNSKDYFHNFCLIQNYDDQTQSENCWLGDNSVSLPDLDTTREDVKGLWYDWVEALVSNYSSKIRSPRSPLHPRKPIAKY